MTRPAIELHSDAASCARAALPILMERETENQIIICLLENPQAGPSPFELLLSVRNGEGKIIGAATKNQGNEFKVILSRMNSDEAAAVAQACHRALKTPLIGVLAVTTTAEAFAHEWQRLRPCSLKVHHHQGIFECPQLTQRPRASGQARIAVAQDLELILEWRRLFMKETGLDPETPQSARTRSEKTLNRKGFWVWTDNDQVTSILSVGGDTPHGSRIGLVYTPSSLRGRSYAAANVAAATQHILDSGKKFGFLYTDLANPVSNRIYERIGYRKIAESVDIRFV